MCYGPEFVAKAVQEWIGAVGAGTVRNFVRRLGMMGAKEPTDAATQRADYS
jgi:hypothetical protein